MLNSKIDFAHAMVSVMDALDLSDNVTDAEYELVKQLLLHAQAEQSGTIQAFPRVCEKLNIGLNGGYLTSDGRAFSKIEFVAEYLRSRGGMDGLSDEFILDEAHGLNEYVYLGQLPWLMTGHYRCTDEHGSSPKWVKA